MSDDRTDRPPRLAGIVLAGGGSTRFGTDKLDALLDGRPLLWHALEPVAPLVDELLVVVGHEAPTPTLPRLDEPAVVVRDAAPGGGPLLGLLAGLQAASAPVALVVGGDMPLVRPAILRALAAAVSSQAACRAAALFAAGRLQPLPCAVRVEPCLALAKGLVAAGERSLRSVVGAPDAIALDEVTWRRLDPDASSLRDVDTRLDLERIEREIGAPRG